MGTPSIQRGRQESGNQLCQQRIFCQGCQPSHSRYHRRMADLISTADALKPTTSWQETKWAYMGEEELVDHTTRARLCVATLLPFKDRQPDWDSFIKSVRWMQECGAYYGIEMVFV